ncbi:MAG: hypothetical protein MH137_01195 [Flavobacteriales bacterium]|nr:hypothetical protein [Flavobacteriales bacterium]
MNSVIQLQRIFKSTGVFVLGYLIVFFICQLLTAGFAYSIGNLNDFSLLKIGFNYDYNHWSKLKIVYVFGLPTFLLVVLASVIQLFIRINPQKGVVDFFLLWFCIAAFNLLGAQFYLSFFYLFTEIEQLNQGFSNIMVWLDISIIPSIILAIVMSVILSILGYRAGILFFGLFLHQKNNDADSVTAGPTYFLEMYLIPFALGAPLIMLLQNEESRYFHFFYQLAYPVFGLGLFLIKKNMPFRFKSIPNVFAKIPAIFPVLVLLVWVVLYFLL